MVNFYIVNALGQNLANSESCPMSAVLLIKHNAINDLGLVPDHCALQTLTGQEQPLEMQMLRGLTSIPLIKKTVIN